MAKAPKLKVLDVADIPLREVSGLAVDGGRLLAVGDHDPVVFSAAVEPWPLGWHGTDLAGLDLPGGGVQFEAVQSAGEDTVLLLQEQPARVLQIDLATPALVGTLVLDVPEGHRLREAWLGDRSSRGESMVVTECGHLLVVKEKDPPAILEFGPPGDAPVGWRRGSRPTPPAPGDAAYTVLATWWLGETMHKQLPDISDATVGPDGRLYLLSDQGCALARLPDLLDPRGGTIEPVAVWRIAGSPQNPEGLVILPDGTVLVGLDTKAPKRNLLRLEQLPLD
ncbi:MAG: hypothetical protein U0R66_03050 [Mycobacterium sp.]